MRNRRAQTKEQDSIRHENRELLIEQMLIYFEDMHDMAYWVVNDVMTEQQVEANLDDLLTMDEEMVL